MRVPWLFDQPDPLVHHSYNSSPVAKGLTLRGPASATSVTSHGDGLLLLDDVLEELLGALKLPAIDRLGRLAGVLEGRAEVRPAGPSRLRRGNLSRCVPNLNITTTCG